MSVFKKSFNEQDLRERNSSKLDEALLSLDKARVDLEDHLFHAQETKMRVKMLEQRVLRLNAERELLPAQAEQMSWLRKAVLYVRDAFAKPLVVSQEQQTLEMALVYYCRHINETDWVQCAKQEYLELLEDPLYDVIVIPIGYTPPDVILFPTLRYKPADASSNDGDWAVCSHTFWRNNRDSKEIVFEPAMD